jgi:hypothetical protein
MGVVQRFDPPAFLPDFNSISGQLDAWHRAMSNWFDVSIDRDRPLVPGGEFQFYNPSRFDPGGTTVEQAVTWNAFPKELLRQFGRARALREADTLWTIDRYYSDLQAVSVDRLKYPEMFRTFFRPQNEYCEWHVVRDSNTNQITRVTFTSEPPEFWFALAGCEIPGDPNQFPGDPKTLLSRYQEFVSPEVQADDLIAKETIDGPQGPFAIKGKYNPYNKWNTTHGIVHLGAPPNSLTAEVQLGADATVLRKDSLGRLLVEAEALICCAGYGGPDRNSDPTIGATINALARAGAYITIKNPVGLYMDHIDLSGWRAPNDADVSKCVRTERGAQGMIERMVVEVPKEFGFVVGDLRIGGESVAYGGQIAECITVKLVGLASLTSNRISNKPAPCEGRCCVDFSNATALHRAIKLGTELPIGTRPAFVGEGASEKLPAERARMAATEGAPEVEPRKAMVARFRTRAYFE